MDIQHRLGYLLHEFVDTFGLYAKDTDHGHLAPCRCAGYCIAETSSRCAVSQRHLASLLFCYACGGKMSARIVMAGVDPGT